MAFHALPEYCSWLDLPRLRYSNQHMIFGMCTKVFNSFLLSKLTGSILNRKYYTYLGRWSPTCSTSSSYTTIIAPCVLFPASPRYVVYKSPGIQFYFFSRLQKGCSNSEEAYSHSGLQTRKLGQPGCSNSFKQEHYYMTDRATKHQQTYLFQGRLSRFFFSLKCRDSQVVSHNIYQIRT